MKISFRQLELRMKDALVAKDIVKARALLEKMKAYVAEEKARLSKLEEKARRAAK